MFDQKAANEWQPIPYKQLQDDNPIPTASMMSTAVLTLERVWCKIKGVYNKSDGKPNTQTMIGVQY